MTSQLLPNIQIKYCCRRPRTAGELIHDRDGTTSKVPPATYSTRPSQLLRRVAYTRVLHQFKTTMPVRPKRTIQESSICVQITSIANLPVHGCRQSRKPDIERGERSIRTTLSTLGLFPKDYASFG